MFWVVLAWAGASLCRSTVLWLRYKQGFLYQTSCTTAASHVEENSGSLCLFRGCCVESGIGLCRGEQRGGSGVCGSAGEPGSQSGRWLEPPSPPQADIHPTPQTHTYMWTHIFTEAHISTYEYGLHLLFSSLKLLSTVDWGRWRARQATGNTRQPCLQGQHVMQQLHTPERLEPQESRIN